MQASATIAQRVCDGMSQTRDRYRDVPYREQVSMPSLRGVYTFQEENQSYEPCFDMTPVKLSLTMY